MLHVFFIHSSVNGHLGCFHVLSVVNSAVLNIEVLIPFQTVFFSRYMLRSRLQCERPGFDPWVGKLPWRRAWQPTPVFLPGKTHRQRILMGYSPKGCKDLDMTELLNTHAHSPYVSFLEIFLRTNIKILHLSKDIYSTSNNYFPKF